MVNWFNKKKIEECTKLQFLDDDDDNDQFIGSRACKISKKVWMANEWKRNKIQTNTKSSQSQDRRFLSFCACLNHLLHLVNDQSGYD